MSMVIVALGLLGVVMAVLGRGTNTMLFQADRAYLQAVERNLTASGLTWARQQVQGQTSTTAAPVVLDVDSLGFRPARLAISFTEVGAVTAGVRVEVACAKGRQSVERAEDHTLRFAR